MSQEIRFVDLLPGHRLTTFDSGEPSTNRWITRLVAPSRERLQPFVLTRNNLVIGAMVVSQAKRRTALPDGYIEIVAFGVDIADQRRGFGRSMLAAVVQMILDDRNPFGNAARGITCRSQGEACTRLLVSFGFTKIRTNLYGLRLS